MAIQEYWPLTKFPWLTNSKVAKLEELTAGLSWMEKIQRQRSLYEQVLEKKWETDYLNQRNSLINGLLFKANKEKSPEERNRLQNQARIENLADIIKEKYQLPYDTKSDDIMERVIQDTQNKGVSVDSFQNYLNKGDENYLYEMGYKERWFWGKLWHNLTGGFQSMREWAKGLSGKAVSLLAGYDMNAFNNYLQSKYGKSVLNIDSAILDKEEAYIKANPDFLKEYWTSVSQDILNYGEGLLDTTFMAGAPILKGGMSAVGSTEAGEKLLKPVSALFWGLGIIVNKVPGLKQFKESLPEQDQERFDVFIGNVAWGLLLWMKNKGNIVKNPKQFILENLNPTELTRNFQENVLAIPKKWLQSIDHGLSNNGYTKNKELFIKWVKPTVKGKQNITDYARFVDDGLEGIASIVKNKENLKFINDIGEESIGQLPKNLSEFSDAISQTKKKIYSEYDALAKNAGENGALVSTEWIINELKQLENNRTLRLANPGIDGIISNMKKGLEEIGTLTVEEAQTFSQHLNQNLKAFYKNWNANDIGRSTVEALVNNNLKKAIDESIENTLWQGEQYSHLKKQYGQLRNIEEEVAKRALVDQRKNAKNLFDLTDIYSANQVIDSLANLNPIGLVKWGATSLIKNWYKKLNDPNVQIKKLFENIDKEISQNGQLREKGNRWTDTKDWINEKLVIKTWNSKQSEYTSTEKSSSITSPWNIRAESIDSVAKPPIATTFSLWTKSITLNGKKYYHQHSWSSFKTKHTFNPTKDTAGFVENFNTALQKWENFALIGKYKGNDVKIYFNNNFANHFIKHWGFKAENLVETINNYDAVNIWSKNRYVFEKELPNGRWLRAITTKNFSEITFFETKNKFKWWEVIEKGLDKLREWAETTQELTLYRGLKEGGKKKFSFDAYTDSKKVARWYGEKIITEKISPKKLADFSNPSDELLQIIKDNWKGGKWYDIERLRKLATAEKFSAGTNMYEIFDDVNVRNALKNAGYDYVKFNDFGKDFKPHTTYFATDVESRWPKSKVLNESREEKITLKSAYQWDWNLAPIINRLGTKGSKTMKILDVSNNVKTILKKMWVESEIKGHYLSSNWVQHILKRHGEWAKDLKFYEIPVSIEDIKLIPKIISEADEIMPSPKTTGKLNRPAIIYKKKMGNKYYYVESVNTKDGKLEPQSMYINKP